jgi:glycosyltransferase involved in cell wall biosynthesis
MDFEFEIAVCVITYRRPERLKSLIISLSKIRFTKIAEPSWKLIIVDNDPTQSAREIVMPFIRNFPVPIIYDVEPTRGISSARNKAIDVAGNVEWIVFIDDDQVALPCWLEELILCQRNYDANVVAGPVLPVYEDGCPDWVKKSGYFSRKRRKTGSVIPYAGTGNLMIQREIFDEIRFETSLNLTGTEDTLFSMRLREKNIKIIWCDEAISYEVVPSSRANLAYILKREYHKGNAYSLVQMIIRPSIFTFSHRLAKGLGNVIVGCIFTLPLWVFEGRAGLAKALWRVARGLGSITGALGMNYRFYRNPK